MASVRNVETHIAKIDLQNMPHVVGTLQDITERKKAAELNEYLAYHDFLTGLPKMQDFFIKNWNKH